MQLLDWLADQLPFPMLKRWIVIGLSLLLTGVGALIR
jgi:hypothetical protein